MRIASPRSDSRSSRLLRRVEPVLWLVLLAFGATVLIGIARSVVGLVGLGHPDTDFGYIIFDDALQMYAGHWPYQDPTVGYAGLLYPPGYTALLAAVLHVKLWAGWGIIISVIAGLALSAMTAAIAYRPDPPPADKARRVLEAAAFGLLGAWLVAFAPVPSSFESRPDTMAWALALGGLLLVPRGMRGSRPALVAAVFLLTAAFWTKQPAATAGIAAGCWALLAAALGVSSWRRAIGFIAAMAAINAAIAGLLALASHGWAFFYIFELGRRHYWGLTSYQEILQTTWQTLWLPAAFAAVTLGAGALAWTRSRRTSEAPPRRLAADRDVQQLVLLGLFLIVTAGFETYFQRKQGSGHENHLLGQLWGIAMLAAVGWRCAGHLLTTRIVTGAAAACLLLIGITAADHERGWADHVPKVMNVVRLPEIPPFIVDISTRGTVYNVRWSDLGMKGDHVPANLGTCDLAAGGLPATGLERDLAHRRYDYAIEFFGIQDGDCSGFGKWEENYFWKLNRLISAGYKQDPKVHVGITSRRTSTQLPPALLLACFAPYRLAGVLFRIGHGGGFWCQGTRRSPRLELTGTPAARSEILTDGTVTDIRGSIVVSMPNGQGVTAMFSKRSGDRRALARFDADALARPGKMVITVGAAPGPAARAAIRRGARSVAVAPSAIRGGQLSFDTTSGSNVQLDFSDLTIHTKDGTLRGAITRRGLPGAGDI